MIENISNWLEKQGYPLEMRTAEAFRKGGFSVVQSRYFEDPDEGTLREIDLTAARVHFDSNPLASVVFTVECKSSPDKSWILFTPPQEEEEWVLNRFEGTAAASSFAKRQLTRLNSSIDLS